MKKQTIYILVDREKVGDHIIPLIKKITPLIPQLLEFHPDNYPTNPKIQVANYHGGRVAKESIAQLEKLGKENNFSVCYE